MKTREQKRNEASEKVCRELRYQMSNPSEKHGDKLGNLLIKWMRLTGKVKYERA